MNTGILQAKVTNGMATMMTGKVDGGAKGRLGMPMGRCMAIWVGLSYVLGLAILPIAGGSETQAEFELLVASPKTSQLFVDVEAATGRSWTELIKEFGVVPGATGVIRCEPWGIQLKGSEGFVSGAGSVVLAVWRHQDLVNERDLVAFFDEKTPKVERERFLQRIGIWLEWDE